MNRRFATISAAFLLGALIGAPFVARAQDEGSKPAAAAPETTSETDRPAMAPQPPSIGAQLADRVRALKAVPAGRERDERTALAAFYAARGSALWTDGAQFTSRANTVIAELAKADDWGLSSADFPRPAAPTSIETALDTDVALSLAVLKYARHARGGRMDLTDLSNSIDREAQLLDPAKALEGIAAAAQPDIYLQKLHPQHPQFERLRQLYLSMRAGALPQAEAEPVVEPEVDAKGRKKKAKKPVQTAEAPTARKVLHNMEMWRWMPEKLGAMYVTVNIPEFTLRVVKGGRVIHSERVITGKVENQTPIFSDEMETVVFHPSWGVPNSIKVKELLPGLLRGNDTLARNGLRATYRGREVDSYSIDWATTDIRKIDIIQPPGSSNVLGNLKFLFPNKHDVYMHDTPTKNLFNADVRAFSHGCMRVRNPVRLAEIVLGQDQGWTPERVAATLRNGTPNNNVQLNTRIPVHITYFTVTVDDEGKPSFFRDIYGHEKLVQIGLEGKAHLIVKKKEDLNAARADVVARLADMRPSYKNKDWFSQLFGGF
jgi:murein L,D-transpeptidase YcbB/YkuD